MNKRRPNIFRLVIIFYFLLQKLIDRQILPLGTYSSLKLGEQRHIIQKLFKDAEAIYIEKDVCKNKKNGNFLHKIFQNAKVSRLPQGISFMCKILMQVCLYVRNLEKSKSISKNKFYVANFSSSSTHLVLEFFFIFALFWLKFRFLCFKASIA